MLKWFATSCVVELDAQTYRPLATDCTASCPLPKSTMAKYSFTPTVVLIPISGAVPVAVTYFPFTEAVILHPITPACGVAATWAELTLSLVPVRAETT